MKLSSLRACAVVLLSLALARTASALQTQIHVYTVPNVAGDDWTKIQETLNLVGTGPAVVKFLAGQYDIFSTAPDTGKRQSLELKDTSSVIIRGAPNGGTTLVLHGFEPSAPIWESDVTPNHAYPRKIFSFKNNQNLRFERLTVKMEREPYSIGKVTAQTTTGNIRSVTLEMDQAYPGLASGFRIQRIDDFGWTPPRRLRGQGFNAFLNDGDYETVVSHNPPGTTQVTLTNTLAGITANPHFYFCLSNNLMGNDSGLVLMHSKYNCHFIKAEHCSGFTVKDVTLEDMPGMGVIVTNGHDVTIDNFDLHPRDDNHDLVFDRLLSIGADGVHLQDCTGNVLIENCDMQFQGDDGVNVHSKFLEVAASCAALPCPAPLPPGGNTLVLDGSHSSVFDIDWAPNGSSERLQFFAPDLTRRVGTANLVGFAPQAPNSSVFNATFWGGYPASVAPGDFVCNTDKAPISVIIQYCRFEDKIARGVTVHGTNVLVADCTFLRTTGPAIMLEAEVHSFFEAQPGDGFYVVNSHIDDCNRNNLEYLGAISVLGLYGTPSFACQSPNNGLAPAGLHRNVWLEHNDFKNLNCDVANRRAAIWVTSTDLVHFKSNLFTNIGFDASSCERNILRLENSTQATSFGDNRVVGFPSTKWFTFVNSTSSITTQADPELW